MVTFCPVVGDVIVELCGIEPTMEGGRYVQVWVGDVVPEGPRFAAEWVVEGEALMSIDIMVV